MDAARRDAGGVGRSLLGRTGARARACVVFRCNASIALLDEDAVGARVLDVTDDSKRSAWDLDVDRIRLLVEVPAIGGGGTKILEVMGSLGDVSSPITGDRPL